MKRWIHEMIGGEAPGKLLLVVALTVCFAVVVAMFAANDARAHGGDGPQFDFAVVGYDKPLHAAAEEMDARGFAVEHIEYGDRHETCNEHGARREAQNDHKLGKVAAYAFAGNYDYSICGETSPCCTVYYVNGSYRDEEVPDNGYIDA